MKTGGTYGDEALWAYLHGELEPARREGLAAAARSDSELARRLRAARRMDRLLRKALGGAAGAADLEEEALAAWERERERERDAACGADAGAGRRVTASRWGWWTAAAAAAVLALAVPVLRTPRGLAWAPPEYRPLVLRGEGAGADGGGVGAAEAGRAQAALRAAVEREARARGVALPAGVTVAFRVQALRGGALSVCVAAQARAGGELGVWGGDYTGMASFLSHVEASAARMVEDLGRHAALAGAGGRGRP